MLEWSIDGVIYTQCVECGKVIKIAPNRTRCHDCQKRHNREYMREYHKQRRKKFAKMGLCPWCGKPTQNGATHCIECLDKFNEKRRKKRK